MYKQHLLKIVENDTTSIGSKWSFKIGENTVDNSGGENPFDVFDVKKIDSTNTISLAIDCRSPQYRSLGLMVTNNKFLKFIYIPYNLILFFWKKRNNGSFF